MGAGDGRTSSCSTSGSPGSTDWPSCDHIRREATTPIIVLSARDQERDKVAALDAGADDYLTKPFGMAELHARLRAAMRRVARRRRPRPAARSASVRWSWIPCDAA